MVYVVTLLQVMPRTTCMEVYESFRDALERAAIWAGMDEHQALASSNDELQRFVTSNPMCTIQTAEFFPKLPIDSIDCT